MFNELGLYIRLYPKILNLGFIREAIWYLLKGVSKHPISINFLITSRCNFRCKICSYYGNSEANSPELSFQGITDFLDQVQTFKPIIFLGGGEPFVRDDIYSILKEIEKRGLKVIVSTNGYLLDLDKISSLNLDSLIFSLYGSESIHDSITGVPGSYSVVVKKIKKIAADNMVKNLIVSTVLLPLNFKSLLEFSDSVFALGVDSIKIENLNYLTEEEFKRSAKKKGGLVLRPHTLVLEKHCFSKFDLEYVWNNINILRRKYKGRLFLKPALNKRDFLKWYCDGKAFKGCHFIRHSTFVSPSGDIIPCQFLRETKLGKIDSNAVEYIWNSKRYNDFREFMQKAGLEVCKRCCK
ncbi:MAG: radical SAM protein [Candidatus Kaelpia aquatica]|nr:radical SAM protein [Candidatus Kaelpia aquatica]